MRNKVFTTLFYCFLLSACAAAPETASTTQTAAATAAANVEAGSIAAVETPEPLVLTVWIPDTFAGPSAAQSHKLLEDQITAFESSHPGLDVAVRYKNIRPSQGMSDLLSTTYRVAPALLPDLVLLDQADMESSAVKGMILPLDGLAEIASRNRLLPSFMSPAVIQGSSFALPAVGDALLLLNDQPGSSENTWQAIQNRGERVAAGLNDADGTLFVALYLAQGGRLLDASNRPNVDAAALKDVLTFIRQSGSARVFTDLSLHAGWVESAQEYAAGDANVQVNWYSYADTVSMDGQQISALPGISDTPATLVTGWYWASANQAASHAEARGLLLAALTEPGFASPWCFTSGYLPVSQDSWPSLLPGQSTLPTILSSARALPDSALLATVGPILREAAVRAMTTTDDIDEIAASVIERINQ
jgi:hypothetical protein